jgi:predicted CXXCH cytochrome family protein
LTDLFNEITRILSNLLSFETLSQVLRYPELHASELAALVGLVIVIFFIVVAAVAFAYSRQRSRTRTEEETIRLSFAGAIAALVVFGLALVSPFAYFNSQNNCLRCHEEPLHELRFEAMHAEVSCRDCHVEPGAIATLDSYFKMIAKLLEVSQGRVPQARCCVSARTCFACHDDIRNGKLTRNRVTVRHVEIIDERIPCRECHPATKSAGRAVTPLTVMRLCGQCHDGRTASAACPLCHTPFGPTPKGPYDLSEYPKRGLVGESPLLPGDLGESTGASTLTPGEASTTTLPAGQTTETTRGR